MPPGFLSYPWFESIRAPRMMQNDYAIAQRRRVHHVSNKGAQGAGNRLPVQPVGLSQALSKPTQDLFVEEDRQGTAIALIDDEADRIRPDINDADGPAADDSPLTQGLNRIVRARLFVLR